MAQVSDDFGQMRRFHINAVRTTPEEASSDVALATVADDVAVAAGAPIFAPGEEERRTRRRRG